MRLTEIRERLDLSYADLAESCGVSKAAAWQIVNRRGRKVGLTRSRIASVRAWLVWRFRKAGMRDSERPCETTGRV
jgi:transcriptional regulator with XRE-family HTH domain